MTLLRVAITDLQTAVLVVPDLVSLLPESYSQQEFLPWKIFDSFITRVLFERRSKKLLFNIDSYENPLILANKQGFLYGNYFPHPRHAIRNQLGRFEWRTFLESAWPKIYYNLKDPEDLLLVLILAFMFIQLRLL